jgi:hypothetical protein
MIIGVIYGTALITAIIYVPFLNIAFNSRPVASSHFIVPACSFTFLIIMFDEIRKVFVREGIQRNRKTGAPEFNGWVTRNTLY